jgi:hypothetical protein
MPITKRLGVIQLPYSSEKAVERPQILKTVRERQYYISFYAVYGELELL